MSSIFREKSIKRVSSPEQLDDYLRVTTPSVWLVLLALVILLVGILAWSVFGTVTLKDSNGNEKTTNPISIILN